MKIRTDFVTNSSSSSYVIGRTDDTSVTADSVFRLIRKLYAEDHALCQRIEEIISTNHSIDVFDTKEGKRYFCCYSEEEGFERVFENAADIPADVPFGKPVVDPELFKKLNDIFTEKGITMYWKSFEFEELGKWWEVCETFEEYDKYCRDRNTYPKFTITDYSIPRKKRDICDETSTDSHSDVLGWYLGDAIEIAFHTLDKDCDNCEGKACIEAWNDEEKEKNCSEHCHNGMLCGKLCMKEEAVEEINNYKAVIREKNIPEELACLYFLGRTCVHSWDMQIPVYVSDCLVKCAEYSCVHMG